MKQYLKTLHTKPKTHKKRFAFLVSGTITLIIFALWSFVTFSSTTVVASAGTDNNLAAVTEATSDVAPAPETSAVTPFQDLISGITSSFEALKQTIGQAKQTVGNVNLNQDYQNIKSDALNTNGQ